MVFPSENFLFCFVSSILFSLLGLFSLLPFWHVLSLTVFVRSHRFWHLLSLLFHPLFLLSLFDCFLISLHSSFLYSRSVLLYLISCFFPLFLTSLFLLYSSIISSSSNPFTTSLHSHMCSTVERNLLFWGKGTTLNY